MRLLLLLETHTRILKANSKFETGWFMIGSMSLACGFP